MVLLDEEPVAKHNEDDIYGSSFNENNTPTTTPTKGRKPRKLIDDDTKKMLLPMTPTAELLESDQIYLLDDQSFLWLYIGRSVSQELIEEIFSINPSYPYERSENISINGSTHMGERAIMIIDNFRIRNIFKPGL